MAENLFKNIINERKFKIAKIIIFLLLIPGLISFIIYTYYFTLNIVVLQNTNLVIYFVVILYNLIILLILFYYKRLGIDFLFTILTFILLIPIFILVLYGGTLYLFVYLLCTILIIINAYVFNIQRNIIFFLLIIFIVLVLLLQNYGILNYNQELLFSDPISTFISIILLYVVFRISNIGFQQIEHSYNQAYSYALELEKINENLDELVSKRTFQLEQTLKQQTNSLHQLVLAGKIAKPIFHDISTPLSIIKGNVELIEDDFGNKRSIKIIKEKLINIEKAELHIEKIINSSKEILNNNKNIEKKINIYASIENVLSVLRSEIILKNIKMINNVKKEYSIYGKINLFERVLVNLIMNSINALDSVSRKRTISFKVKEYRDKIKLSIYDNGIGIESKYLPLILSENYSSKNDSYNHGIGLLFVKDIIEKDFCGKVEVKSIYNEYTQIDLFLPFSIKSNE